MVFPHRVLAEKELDEFRTLVITTAPENPNDIYFLECDTVNGRNILRGIDSRVDTSRLPAIINLTSYVGVPKTIETWRNGMRELDKYFSSCSFAEKYNGGPLIIRRMHEAMTVNYQLERSFEGFDLDKAIRSLEEDEKELSRRMNANPSEHAGFITR